ncbi:MAG TPA: DUF692 domain-containing protein [Xanthobacteraceae bacterium]|jgi:hypothetical protein
MFQKHQFGLGLRKPHYRDFIEGVTAVPVDFVEVISENFMVDGGRPLHILKRVRERHPIALHGVSMSLGSVDGLRDDYLRRLRSLAKLIDPIFISDHLSWSRFEHFNSHDLLPLPYTKEALDVVSANIQHAQDTLGRTMLIENPSSYVSFPGDMTEWEFLDAICSRTGCGLLLDVNNVYVSASNHGFDAQAYLSGIPAARVGQIHLAGHSRGRDLLIDTHDKPVPDPVWSLYASALDRIGPVATMIERDGDIPPLSELLAELELARNIAQGKLRRAA